MYAHHAKHYSSSPPTTHSNLSSSSTPSDSQCLNRSESDPFPQLLSQIPNTNTNNSLDRNETTAIENSLEVVNKPVFVTTGQFAGRRLRFELKEIQAAKIGRKYARVDRRPLDPPPVVLLRIYESIEVEDSEEGGGEEKEQEVDYEDILTQGFICVVDLFPATVVTTGPRNSKSNSKSEAVPTSTFSGRSCTRSRDEDKDGHTFMHCHHTPESSSSSLLSTDSHAPRPFPNNAVRQQYRRDQDSQFRVEIPNDRSLVGATFVQPFCVELSGQKRLVFVFSDLAVRDEGIFRLRYRVFDLFSHIFDSNSPQKTTIAKEVPGPAAPIHPSRLTSSSTSIVRPRRKTNPYPTPPAQLVIGPRPRSNPNSNSNQRDGLGIYPRPSDSNTKPPCFTSISMDNNNYNHGSSSNIISLPQEEPEPEINPNEEGDGNVRILAECWSDSDFKIYSTKEFPGLPVSTDLTKHLTRYGVRLNIRETERRGRRRSMMDEYDFGDSYKYEHGCNDEEEDGDDCSHSPELPSGNGERIFRPLPRRQGGHHRRISSDGVNNDIRSMELSPTRGKGNENESRSRSRNGNFQLSALRATQSQRGYVGERDGLGGEGEEEIDEVDEVFEGGDGRRGCSSIQGYSGHGSSKDSSSIRNNWEMVPGPSQKQARTNAVESERSISLKQPKKGKERAV